MKKTLAAALLSLACLPMIAPLAAYADAGLDLNHKTGGITSNRTERNGHASYTVNEAKSALAQLPAAQAKEFKLVHQALASHKPAQVQLEALLAKHRVKYADAFGHTVLDNLATLASKPTNHSIDRAQALADVVADICRPATIAQAQHNSCTATSIQANLARNRPAEYARLVAGLATAGHVDVPSSHVSLASNLYIAYKDRTISSNLMQPAIMDLEAKVEGGHYDNKVDKIFPAKGAPHEGAFNKDVSTAESQLIGGKYTTEIATNANRDKLMAIVAHASSTDPVLVGVMMAGGGGHEVQVTGYKKASGKVEIRNPWGERDYIPAAKFKAALEGVNYRQN